MGFAQPSTVKKYRTRMHSSRMRTARSLIVSPYLVVSQACHPLGATTHAPPEQPCMPPLEQPYMPPLGVAMHAPLEQPCMPPPQSNHAHPPEQPCMPPGATTHAPQSNHTHPLPPGSNHACPPVNRITNRFKNITLPQTSFAGGNKGFMERNTYDWRWVLRML